MVAAALAWVAAMLGGALSAGLAGYLPWRVIAERRAKAEDDRYDRIGK